MALIPAGAMAIIIKPSDYEGKGIGTYHLPCSPGSIVKVLKK